MTRIGKGRKEQKSITETRSYTQPGRKIGKIEINDLTAQNAEGLKELD